MDRDFDSTCRAGVQLCSSWAALGQHLGRVFAFPPSFAESEVSEGQFQLYMKFRSFSLSAV